MQEIGDGREIKIDTVKETLSYEMLMQLAIKQSHII